MTALQAIQTSYRGYKFRSRLEATWAAFFDLMEWRWEYEPVEFDGWIPDFVLLEDTTCYVEVKPVYELPLEVVQKIDAADPPSEHHEVLIVGATLHRGVFAPLHNLSLGWLREGECWANAPIALFMGRATGCQLVHAGTPGDIICHHPPNNFMARLGFCHGEGSYRDRITGCYDGGQYGIAAAPRVTLDWAEAKNISQWNPRK